jgi:hypothetical protein
MTSRHWLRRPARGRRPRSRGRLGREITLAPAQVLVRPGILEPPDGRGRNPTGILAEQFLTCAGPRPSSPKQPTCRRRPGAPSNSTYPIANTARHYEQKARPLGCAYRQFFITDLGHDEPTILLTNDTRDRQKSHHPLCQAHAHRECARRRRALLPHRCAVLIDFDMALLVLASDHAACAAIRGNFASKQMLKTRIGPGPSAGPTQESLSPDSVAHEPKVVPASSGDLLPPGV